MQRRLHAGIYTRTADGIKISVLPEYLEDSSEPERCLYAFAYTITIENMGDDSVQLLERHWVINSGGEPIAEVVGPGVVGEQPILIGGESYEYTSGAVIQDPVGTMEGSYTFRANDGQYFEVQIPEFDLCSEIIFH